MHQGYIALWRKFRQHPFWKEKRTFSKAEAWIDILWSAQHDEKPREVILGMTAITQNYGECLKSVGTWAYRWGWTGSKVRRFFKLLERLNQIRTKSEGVTTRLIVLNYDSYDPKRRASDEQTTSKRRANDEQTTTKKNGNNGKNGKNGNNNIPDEKIQEQIQVLKNRYQNQPLLDEIFKALASTRRTGKIAESVILSQLEKWDRYPVESVVGGIQKYLDRDCAGDGKREEYLLGIIRNYKPDRPKQPKTGGQNEFDDKRYKGTPASEIEWIN